MSIACLSIPFMCWKVRFSFNLIRTSSRRAPEHPSLFPLGLRIHSLTHTPSRHGYWQLIRQAAWSTTMRRLPQPSRPEHRSAVTWYARSKHAMTPIHRNTSAVRRAAMSQTVAIILRFRAEEADRFEQLFQAEVYPLWEEFKQQGKFLAASLTPVQDGSE